jgi:signal transduction histidine kinase
MVALRGPDEASAGAHLGLGLYIVRLVAEFHGGKVRARNLPGADGVRFEVELP